jgi:hypothetical protein
MTECQHIPPWGVPGDSLCPGVDVIQLRQLAGSLPVDAARRLADPQPCLIGPGVEILAHRLLPKRAVMGAKFPPHKTHKNIQNLANSREPRAVEIWGFAPRSVWRHVRMRSAFAIGPSIRKCKRASPKMLTGVVAGAIPTSENRCGAGSGPHKSRRTLSTAQAVTLFIHAYHHEIPFVGRFRVAFHAFNIFLITSVHLSLRSAVGSAPRAKYLHRQLAVRCSGWPWMAVHRHWSDRAIRRYPFLQMFDPCTAVDCPTQTAVFSKWLCMHGCAKPTCGANWLLRPLHGRVAAHNP